MLTRDQVKERIHYQKESLTKCRKEIPILCKEAATEKNVFKSRELEHEAALKQGGKGVVGQEHREFLLVYAWMRNRRYRTVERRTAIDNIADRFLAERSLEKLVQRVVRHLSVDREVIWFWMTFDFPPKDILEGKASFMVAEIAKKKMEEAEKDVQEAEKHLARAEAHFVAEKARLEASIEWAQENLKKATAEATYRIKAFAEIKAAVGNTIQSGVVKG